MGLYTAALDAGTEVSSTYEGRHLTVLETELIHPDHDDDLVDKGDPVIIVLADATNPHGVKGHAVGVALKSATAITDYIAIDTEGIWNLKVFAFADTGGEDVNPGDPLYISDDSAQAGDGTNNGVGDAVLSKIKNRALQVPFGYALGYIGASAYGVIAVKVHWDPSVAEEVVGVSGGEWASAEVSKHFRDYYYESTGGTYPTGEHFELVIPNTSARVFGVIARETLLTIPGDEWICTGMIEVLTAKLKVTAGDAIPGTWSCLTLDFENENTHGMPSQIAAYITLRDQSVILNSQQMNNIFNFMDISPGVANDHNLFCASANPNESHKLKFFANGVAYWLVVSDTKPD